MTFSQEKGVASSSLPEIETRIWNLQWISRAVKAEDNPAELANIMFRVLREHRAQGLAAVQVGRRLRLIVLLNEPGTPICLVNPLITKSKGSVVADEGCLSLPGEIVPVPRPRRVTIEGLNQYMKPVRYRLEGIRARRACHELDHLNGKLITDYQEEKKDGTGKG